MEACGRVSPVGFFEARPRTCGKPKVFQGAVGSFPRGLLRSESTDPSGPAASIARLLVELAVSDDFWVGVQ